MTDAIAIHGHEIIELVSTHPDGIRLSQLMEIVAERYGRSATFHTCSAHGMGEIFLSVKLLKSQRAG